MLVFSKEKYLESEFKKLLARYNDGNDFVNKLNGKKVTVNEYDDYYCEGTLINKNCCEERGEENMKEMLERWKKSKDSDLRNAFEIIEELQDKYESLQEEFEDYKKDVDENYEQKPFNPYEEYGISESDFH